MSQHLADLLGQQLRLILDHLPIRVALIDRDRRHRYMNAEYATFFGYDAEKVLGRTVADVIGPDAFEPFRAYGERALAGEVANWEGWLPLANASGPRFVQRVYVPFRSEGGSVEAYFIFARDLTAMKHGEQLLTEQLAQLNASEAVNSAITSSALDCIVVVDETGSVIEFNPAAEQTFGYRRTDVMGRKIGMLIVPPEHREAHAAGMQRYLATGEARMLGRRIEIRAMRADGSIFPVELAIQEIRLPGRRMFTAYLRDLTDAKRAEAEIQRQRDALYQSEKMAAFGSLLAGVAHELNNPLSIVIGNALMLREEADELGAQALQARGEKIGAAAERCARIVRTFLAMARQKKAQLSPINLKPTIESTLELLAYGLRTSGIAVSVDVPSDLPPVLGDQDQIGQVLANVIVNARQALEESSPPRRINVVARRMAGAVQIEISDNGPGIADDIRSRVFDPFFTTKPLGAGTGIGLAVSLGIIEAHGGSLTLAAGEHGGATFVIRLPATSRSAPPRPRSGSAAVMPTGYGRTVLIVDDEPEAGSLIAEMLTARGFHCDQAAGGDDARRLLEISDYNIILCDLHMADLDGPGLFDWMTANKPGLCARTAFVTGDALGAAAGRFLSRSGRPVLEKPYGIDELVAVIAQLESAM